MGKIKLGLIGAGLRGNYTYGRHIESIYNCEITSIVEKRKGRRDAFSKTYNIKDENVFETIEEFLEKDKIVDGVIVASGDDNHYNHICTLLEKGYNILVEFPVTNTLDRLVKINRLCEKYKDRLFMTCNSLKYNEMYMKLKEIIQNKSLGELVNIQYNNDIGYVDYSHNYVRGNWRIDSDTSPLILNKNSQDIDILLYLVDSECNKVASFGNLKQMNNNNFKLNMGENCFQCNVENECPYSAKKIYIENENDINYAVHINPTKENLIEILKKGPYGRCVYRCDNNVVDNMLSIIQFENGVNITLNTTAFSKESNKNIKILFSNGEIEASILKQEIVIKEFGKDKEYDITYESNTEKESEKKLIQDFIQALSSKDYNQNKSTAKESLESHIIAFAIEYSRISEEVVYVKDFFNNAIDMTNEIEKVLL